MIRRLRAVHLSSAFGATEDVGSLKFTSDPDLKSVFRQPGGAMMLNICSTRAASSSKVL